MYHFIPSLFLITRNSSSRSAYKRHVVTAAVMIVVLSLGWLLIATSFLGGIIANVNVDTAKQIKGILKNPIQFVMTFVRTLKVYLKEYLLQFLGERMGWMNIYIPSFLLYPFLIILGVEVCMDQDTGKHVFPTYLRVFLGGTSILIFLLVLCLWTVDTCQSQLIGERNSGKIFYSTGISVFAGSKTNSPDPGAADGKQTNTVEQLYMYFDPESIRIPGSGCPCARRLYLKIKT